MPTVTGVYTDRTSAFQQAEGFIDSAGTLLTSFSAINAAIAALSGGVYFSGLTVNASAINDVVSGAAYTAIQVNELLSSVSGLTAIAFNATAINSAVANVSGISATMTGVNYAATAVSGMAGATAINGTVSAISGIAYNAASINSGISAISGLNVPISAVNYVTAISGQAAATAINSVVSAISGIAYNAADINSAVSAVSGIQYNASTINSLVVDAISGLSSGVSATPLNLVISGATVPASAVNNVISGLVTAVKASALNNLVSGLVTGVNASTLNNAISGLTSTADSLNKILYGFTERKYSLTTLTDVVDGLTVTAGTAFSLSYITLAFAGLPAPPTVTAIHMTLSHLSDGSGHYSAIRINMYNATGSAWTATGTYLPMFVFGQP